jgi:parvulin-like peptidyl-prolyl isomerase
MNLRLPLLAALALASPTVHAEPVIGSIGDINLSAAEVREMLESASAAAGQPLQADAEALKQFVRATLIQRLVLERANTAGHADSPAVAKELARARDAALVESFLRTSSAPPEDFPAEAEVADFYAKNKESFLVPKTWRVAQIFISDRDPAASAEAEAEAKLAKVREALAEPAADFASIARRFSDDLTSAPEGGDLGWVRDDQIQPGIREALPGLKINGISEPVRLADGWHILRLIDARETHTPPLAELAPRIHSLLRSNKARENREAYLSELLRDTPPAVNEIELLKLK